MNNSYDVCIIGSGAGGAVAAYSLGRAGLSVLVLEAGPRYNPSDYHTNKVDWERQPNPFVRPDDRVQNYLHTYDEPEVLDEKYASLRSTSKVHGLYNKTNRKQPPDITRVKGIGGSTLHFQGEAHRFSPHGFQSKSLYDLGEDWPLTYDDLAPYYEEAENILGIAGDHTNPYKAPRNPFPNQAHRLSCASSHVKKGFDALGLHLLPNSLNILSKSRDKRPPCNYCNGCHLGCKTGAKGSMDVTYMKQAERFKNVSVRPESVVREITLNKEGRADGVVYIDAGKNEHRITAKIVVLSAGALESPRLLLNSRSALFPDGLANSSGLVGRYFMETLIANVTGLFEQQLHSYKGLQIDSRAWDENEPDRKKDFFGGVVFGVSAMELLGPLSYARLLAPGWGREHKDFMRNYFGHAVNIFAVGEQLPDVNNTITIDPEVTDHHGIPVPKVSTRLGKNDINMLSYMLRRCREIAEAAGAVDILRQYTSYDLSLISHISGTCRMGNDPKRSVVNSYCGSHDVKNLFIVDSSCFVTEGGGDSPSLTIHALALRASEHIINEVKNIT